MLLDRKECPSWEYILATGTTTLTETWRGLQDPDEGVSMNRFALGTVVGWMFAYPGGIRYEKSAPGFTHSVLQPCPIREIGSFGTEYRSASGRISVGWAFADGHTAVYTFETGQNVTLLLPDGSTREFPAGEHRVRL